MFVTRDRTLVDYSQRRVASYWPALLPCRDAVRCVVGTMSSRRLALVRWSSRVLWRGIHVPPMRDAWLRVHDVEHGKHGADP